MPRELVTGPSSTSLSSRGSSSSQSNTPFATPPSSPPDASTMAFPASVSRIPLSVTPSKPTLIAKFRSGSSSSSSSQQQQQQQAPPPAPSSGSGIRVLGSSSTRRPSQSTHTRGDGNGPVSGSSWGDARSPPAAASSLPSGPPGGAFGTSPSAASPAPALSSSADARIPGMGQPQVQRAPAMKRTPSSDGASRVVASGKVSGTAPSSSSSSAAPAPPPGTSSSSSSSGPRKQRSSSALPRRVAGASPRSAHVPSLPSSTNTSPARTPPLPTASTFDALLAASPPPPASPSIALQQPTPPRPTPSTPGSAQRAGLPFPQQPTSPSRLPTHVSDSAPTSTPGGNRQRTGYHSLVGGSDPRLSPPSATSPTLEGAESIESVVDLNDVDDDGYGGGSSVGSHQSPLLNGGGDNQNRASRIPTPTHKGANGSPLGGSPKSPAMGLYEDLAGSSRSSSPGRSGAATPSKSRLPRMAHSSVEEGVSKGGGRSGGGGQSGGVGGGNNGAPETRDDAQASSSDGAEQNTPPTTTTTAATTATTTTPSLPPTSPRPDRKSPGLTIAPPPIPNHHLNSIKAPPVPARSPLRGPGLYRTSSRKSIASVRTVRPDAEATSPPPLPLPLPRSSPQAASAAASTSTTAPTSPAAQVGRSPAASPGSTAAAAAAATEGNVATWTFPPSEPSTAPASGDTMIATPPPPHAAQAAISSPPSFNNVAYAPAPLTSMSAPPLSHVGSPVEEGTPRFPTTERPDFPSVYSQESAPPSAPACSENVWSVGGAGGAPPALSQLQPPAVLNHGSQLTESPIEEDEPLTMLPKRDSLRDSLQWGQKRNSGQTRRGSAAVGSEESHVANMGHTSVDLHGKALPTLPAMSPQSAPRAKDGSIPRTPTTPSRPNADQPATRSPSMPQLPVPRTRARGNTESSPKYARSQTGPAHLRPGQSGHTRPKSMVFPFYPPSPATSSLSKRAHLIREIANTERAHATDLQLIQQAYVGSYIRPDSHHSIGTNGESSNSSGARVNSQHSQRSSSYGTPGSEDARRTSAAESGGHRTSSHERKSVHERRSGHERRISGHDLTKAFGGLMSPVFRGNNTPRERGNSDRSIEHTPITGSMASMDTLYPSGSSTAASSLSINTPAGSSPRTPTQSEAALLAKMGPPVGRPLQPADIKAVFLNLTQLAELSNELAEAFETAMGSEEDLVNGSGERGSDRLGEVFSKMLPRLRPLYTYYCARQSTASVRLTELMSDPATAAYLNDCWLRVKSRTHAWNLDSMLIKPVQRITKYPLLFDDLLSCTSPSHPDYHHIRVAAEQARALALEIDDAKRRKDVITSVIRKSPSIPSVNKDTKLPGPGGRLLALRRFKKDKSPSMSGSSTPGDSGGIPLDISPYAQSQLKELVNRLEEGEQNVRKVGKEMLEWASTTKILLTSEGEVNNDFWKLYSLSGAAPSERPQAKIEAYHNVQKEILATVWTEMNSEVCNSIMLMLGKLLDATKNPMTIIEKLNRKSSEYARYVAFKQAKKTVDRLLLNEASDYVAIHTQLLEELPAFLEGHQKIFEMAMSAFVMAQARFYEGIRDRVQLFAIQYLTMRPIDQATKQERRVSHARGIHRMFYNENSSADKALQRIGCVSGDLSGRPATVPEVLSPGVTSNTSEPPPLRHTPSSRSIKSRSRESSESSGTGRARSMSLVQRDDALSRSGSISAGNSSRLLRRPSQLAQRQDSTYSESSNRSSSGLSLTGAGNRSTASVPPLDRSRTHSRSDSRLTVLSTDSTEESIGRHSFGLPRIPLEGSGLVFDSFGFSPSKPSTPIYPRHDHSGQSSPTTANDPSLAALGLVNGSNSDVLTITMKHRSQPNQSSPLSTTTTSSASVMSNEPDASVSWQGSKTLYSCQAVADFSPSELGNKRFQGLLFLPLATGDLVNVYHEVGRVADLRDFPYTSVGVENDGAVVCCAENGAIGVAMCSFLEPLQA